MSCSQCGEEDQIFALTGPYAHMCVWCAEIQANRLVHPGLARDPKRAEFLAEHTERQRREAKKHVKRGETPWVAHQRTGREAREQIEREPVADGE